MSDAPERIWAWELKPCAVCRGEWDVLDEDEIEGHARLPLTEYIRADLHADRIAALEAEVARLREALQDDDT